MDKNMFIVRKANSAVQEIALTEGRTVKLFAEFDTKYQLINKKGKVVQKPKTKKVDDDLWIFDEENLSEFPDVILEDYYSYFPIENLETLASYDATFATPPYSEQMALGLPTTSAVQTMTFGKILAGGAGIAGLTALSGGSQSDDKTDTSQPVVTPVTASVQINAIPVINKAKASETVQITGTLTKSTNVTTTEVVVTVNGKDYPATVNGTNWTVDIAGSELATRQGDNTLTAKITVTGAQGQTNSDNASKDFTVDTVIAKPVISINPVATDNTLDFNEAKQTNQTISGKVTNANNGDEVTVKVDTNTYTAVVNNGNFSVDIPSNVLTNATDKQITASISTKDTAGNTETATANHTYQVDLTPPVTPITPVTASVQINAIPVINKAKASETVQITGTLTKSTNVTTTEVVVTVNGTDYPATINGTNWKVDIAGSELATRQGDNTLTAKITVTGAQGQTNSNSDSETFTVDTVIAKPVISINPVATDNTLDFNEAKQTNQTISGTVTNANNGDEVLLKVGTKTYTAVVNNASFSVDIPSNVLSANTNISASINTKDTAGNTETATANHTYQVDLTPPVTPITPVTASVQINTIPVINKAKANETVQITGTLTKSANVTTTEVVVTVNGKDYPATVNGTNWTANIAGSELATRQGNNTLTAKITVTGAQGQTDSNTDSETFTVDTVIAKPVISINPIATDNTLDFNEAKQTTQTITGTVTNANNGDEVTVKVDTNTYTAVVNNGNFSVDIPSNVLTNATDKQITASISTKDTAGNTETATANHTYQVDLTPPVTPITPVTASVQINAIPVINKAKASETVQITGTLTKSTNVTTTEVVVTVNGTDYPATINGTNWKVDIAGSELATRQGDNTLTAKITVTGAQGQTNSNSDSETFTVDTVIAKPVISINPVATDNTLDFNEAKQTNQTISGTVTNANNGDEVLLKVGTKTYTAVVNNASFSVDIPSNVLSANTNISASINTKDTAGNTETATANHTYQVDLTPPVTPITPVTASVQINTIPVINKAKANETVQITGTLTKSANVTTTEVVVTVNGKDYPATVNGTNWTANIAGSELATRQGNNTLTAKITVTGAQGQTDSNTDSETFTVDTVIAKPVISINPIATDNTLDFNEAKQTTQTITGTVTNANNGDEVTVKVDTNTYTAVVNNGSFSVDIPSNVLTNATDKQITASINTKDTAGNTETATANHTYQVDLTPPVTPITPVTASVQINAIPVINKAKASETVQITGTLTKSDNVTTTEVVVTVNGKDYPATVTGTNWKVDIAGSELATRQGNNTLTAKITVTGAQGQTDSNTDSETFTVDTVIAKPVISINPIATDNTLDFNEAKQTTQTITGTVTNANNGDEVTVKVDTNTYTAVVNNGSFSVDIPSNVLTNATDKQITASINTKDTAGNTETATANHTYQVDLTPPVTPITPVTASVQINTIPVINKAKANETVQITGTLTKSANVTTTEVVVTVNGKDYPATVTGTNWKVDIAGSELATRQGDNTLTAKITVTGAQGQTDSNTDSETFTVDTVIAKPVISINPIATDNTLDFNEAKQTTQTITGTVTNANNGDEVTVKVDTNTYTAVVNNASFSVDIPSNVLSANTNISASINTKDTAGNTETATANHTYQVDLTPPVTPITPVTASVQINTIPVINKAKANETVQITGTLTKSANVTTTEVVVTVNGKDYPATVNGTNWTANIAGSELATRQGNNTLTAKITVTGAQGQTDSNTDSETFTVDTVIAKPVISINPIATDNTLDFNEAKQTTQTITGTVTNANNGDEVTVKVDTNTYTAVVNNGSFSVDIPSNVLTNATDKQITASINTKDTAGNTETATANHTYQVDLTAPVTPPTPTEPPTAKITMNSDIGNLVINQHTSGTVRIDGTFTVSSSVVKTTIKLNINGELLDAQIEGNKWFVNVPAEKLKYDQGRLPATVRIDVEDAKGTPTWDSTYYNYLVDTVIAKPEITLNNLAGDNEIDYVESGANYQNIKGTVSYSEPNNESTSGEIVFLIDGKEYTNRLDGDSFNVALPTDVLLNAQNKTITAFARTKDSAGNTATSDHKTISYTQDLEELTILVIPDETPIKIKNGTARISGTYETTGTVVKTTITLTDKDGQAIPAEVDTASKAWYADVPVDRLPEPEGVVVVTINALIENKGGENGGTVASDQSSGFYTLIPESLTPSPSMPEVIFDPILPINRQKQGENVKITGKLSEIPVNISALEMFLIVNGKEHKATISGTNWEVDINGAELAHTEGNQTISSKLVIIDQNGKRTESDNATPATYQVDTQIAKPEIRFDDITGDNIINSLEAKAPKTKITGSVENANNGEIVTLTIGNAVATGAVADGKFDIDVDTIALVTHRVITADITTRDTAGNTETASKNHNIAVSKAPSIVINNVTPDNTVNIDEKNNPNGILITGKVGTDWAGKNITVSCGCPSCTGKGWEDLIAKVKEDGSFEVNFDGNVIAENTTIKVTVDENGAEITEQKDYDKDLEAPNHTVTMDKVATDDIINLAESQIAKTTITAKVTGVNQGETVTDAFLTIGTSTQKIPATITNGVLSASVDTALLTNADKVTATVTVKDEAGNVSTKTATKSYQTDTQATASVSIDTVNNGQTINNATAKNGITLTGRMDFADDIDLASLQVVVTINGQNHNATLNTANKTWQLPLSDKLIEGANTATASIIASDKAGNRVNSSSSAQTYNVDTNAQVTVILDEIAGNNIIENSEKSGETTITGRVSGDFKTTDKVVITAGDLTFEVNPNAQGEFSQTINVAELLQQTTLTVNAEIRTTDNVGNPATGKATQTYSIEPALVENTKIQITKIANDDLINVTEAKGEVSIVGVISGNNITQGEIVKIKIGNTEHDAIIDNQFNFKATVNAEELVNNAGYTVTASFKDVSDEHTYRVDSNAVAGINITSIAKDNLISFDDNEVPVRLSGKINAIGAWLEGKNTTYLQAISTTIGSKTYKVAIDEDDQTFFFDIPVNELSAIAGQPITFNVEHPQYIVSVADWGYAMAGWQQDAPILNNSHVSLDANAYITGEQGNYAINADAVKDYDKINVTGTVNGNAQQGDTIDLIINNKVVATGVVNANKGFDILVDKAELNNAQPIIAKLHTKDLAGNDISVQNTAKFALANAGNATMLNAHGKVATSELPYFIKALNIEASYDKFFELQNIAYIKGFLSDKDKSIEEATQKGVNITYNFEDRFDNDDKIAVKDSLAVIEKYTPITFSEIASDQKANIKYQFGSMALGTLGYAGTGGDVTLSKERYYDDGKTLNTLEGFYTSIHETLHTLGAEHPFNESFGNNLDKETLLGKDSILTKDLEDSTNFSVMAYKPHDFDYTTKDLKLYDIAYLHYRFGVNPNQRAENNTYTFKDYNVKSPDSDIYIWDGNGVDTFDASKETNTVYVDLTPGSWIYSGTKAEKFATTGFASNSLQDFFNIPNNKRIENDVVEKNYPGEDILKPFDYTDGQAFIGYDTQIENLVGGSNHDQLYGNKANNAIYGGAGNDTIDGREGDDYLDGGLGEDSLTGGKGNDIYIIDNARDTITEHSGADEGVDLVYSSVNYTLSANVEHLTLIGNVANEATGNNLNNTLISNNTGATLHGMDGNDTLIGGLGSDTLIGGAGADIYVFNTEFNGTIDTLIMDSNDKIHLSADIFNGLTKGSTANLDKHIKYDSETNTLSYDADGSGEIDDIIFAQVAGEFNFTLDKFTVI